MTKTQNILTITLDGVHNRDARDWRGTYPGGVSMPIRSVARAHAKFHGAAGLLFASGKFLLLYREGAKIRQKTWPRVNVRYNGKVYAG